jgi:DNA replicative helicase MCM subunit Mcm2 (Cdc46/Mcm family)
MKFKCQKCGHECEVDARAYHRNAVTCPKCGGMGMGAGHSGAGKQTADTHSLLKYRYRTR